MKRIRIKQSDIKNDILYNNCIIFNLKKNKYIIDILYCNFFPAIIKNILIPQISLFNSDTKIHNDEIARKFLKKIIDNKVYVDKLLVVNCKNVDIDIFDVILDYIDIIYNNNLDADNEFMEPLYKKNKIFENMIVPTINEYNNIHKIDIDFMTKYFLNEKCKTFEDFYKYYTKKKLNKIIHLGDISLFLGFELLADRIAFIFHFITNKMLPSKKFIAENNMSLSSKYIKNVALLIHNSIKSPNINTFENNIFLHPVKSYYIEKDTQNEYDFNEYFSGNLKEIPIDILINRHINYEKHTNKLKYKIDTFKLPKNTNF